MGRARLVLVNALMFATIAVGLIFPIIENVPVEFDFAGDPDTTGDVIVGPTAALTPPLLAMLALAVFTAFALRGGWRETFAALGSIVLGVLFIIAVLGAEHVPGEFSSIATGVIGVLRLVRLFLASLMVLFGVLELVYKIRTSRTSIRF